MLKIAVFAVWVGLSVLAASCPTIWKAACVPNLYASDNSQSVVILIGSPFNTDSLTVGHHGVGALYEHQWPMDRQQATTRVLWRSGRVSM